MDNADVVMGAGRAACKTGTSAATFGSIGLLTYLQAIAIVARCLVLHFFGNGKSCLLYKRMLLVYFSSSSTDPALEPRFAINSTILLNPMSIRGLDLKFGT
ncbi:hypothetical protein GN244_ATG09077 [Phytophthora infestans]|uniref:Uncharacterized protein n=1 Tax=Phytophthora infestans TaxID=4787 RepID=A0A833S2F3_PHYIN|nr:hypothetical protein GN244_ATG09077 [Phytophthora infestans]